MHLVNRHASAVYVTLYLAAMPQIVQAGQALADGQAQQRAIDLVDGATKQRGEDIDDPLGLLERFA